MAEERNTLAWPSIEQFPREIARRINRFFDCAEAYGRDNQAERALGTALAGRRAEAIIASKFGKHKPLWECDGLPEDAMYDVYTKEAIHAALDRSLAALQTDYIDLYQVHWPVNLGLLSETKAAQDEVVAALEEAKLAGKIRYYGVCNFGTDDLARVRARSSVPKLHTP